MKGYKIKKESTYTTDVFVDSITYLLKFTQKLFELFEFKLFLSYIGSYIFNYRTGIEKKDFI